MNIRPHWFGRIGQRLARWQLATVSALVLVPFVGLAVRIGTFVVQQSADVQYGDTVNGQLAADGTQDWHFIAAGGDQVGIHVVRASGDLVAGVTLQDSDGQSLLSAQAANTGDLSLSDVAIARPGAYTIHVFSVAHTAGNYQLVLTNTLTATALPTPISQAAAGTVQYGQPVQGHLDGRTYEQFWRLAGAGADVIDVQMRVVSGDLDSVVALLSPAGDVITTSASQPQANSSTSRDAAIYSVQLPRSGNYTILARRSGDQQGRTGTTSGTYSLSVTVHTVAPDASDSSLAPGDTLTGRLTAAAPISQYRVESGGTLAFRLELGSLHRIARVRLLGSAGTELLARDGLSPLAFSVALPAKGPFFVQVTSDSYEDQAAVDFALSSYKLSALASPLRYGEAQHGLTPGGITPDRWFFVGHVGDLIRLRLTPDSDALDETLTLTGPQDIILFHGVIGPLFDQPFTLPADGAYQIAVQGTSDSTGTLGYQLLVDPFGARNIPFAAVGVTPSKGVLAFGKPVSGTLAAASDDTYTLDASAGQSLNVTVAGQTAAQALGVLIRAPDESLVTVQIGAGTVRVQQAVLPTNGRYSVIVFDPGSATSSPYTVQIEDAGGGSLTAGQSVKGVLLPGDSLAEWSIDAPAGGLLNARLSTRTPAAWTPGLYVVDPTGFVVAHASIGLDKTTLDLTGVSAPMAGRYRLVVAGTVSAAFASYELLANVGTPFATGSDTAPVATLPPAARFAPAPGTPIPAPALADLIDPPLPLDTSASAVQSLPLNTLARGEIAPGALRQIWRLVSVAGNTLAIRAVTLSVAPGDSARGPDLALFDGTTGHIVAEQLHGDTPDTVLSYYSAQGGVYFVAVRLALGNGRYTLYAASQSLAQGALQIKQGTPLIYGQSVFGELEAPDQTDAYYFYGSTNDVISPSVARVIGNLSPGLALITPSGQTLVADANKSLGAGASLGATRLPETGVYTLQVRHADPAPQTTGRYLLWLGLISGSPIKNRLGGLLTPGQTVIGALSPNGNQNTWLLSGQAADHVSLVAAGLSANDSPTPLSVQLQDTSGHPFAQADVQLPQDTVRLTDVLLPADGIYRVQVSGGDQTQGGYQLTWLPASDSGQLPGAIRYGQSISGLFTPTRRADKYTFAGTAGDVITLSMRDVRGDPFRGGFQLLSAGGVPLATAADVGDGQGARVDGLTLPLTGTYSIIAANPDAAFKGAGVYALGLTLQDSKARGMGGLLRDGDHGSGELYPDDPLNTWLFAGHTGDVITAQVTAGDHFLQPQLTLQMTSGQALAQAAGDPGGSASVASFKLPADGVYALAVSGANQTAGSYQIGLTFTPPPIAALASLNYGDSAVGLIADDRPTDLYLFNGRQGDSVSVKAAREPGANLALTLELQTTAGDLLARSDGLGGDTATLTAFVLPETGAYRLVVGRFGGASGHTSGRLNVTLTGKPAAVAVRGKLTSGQTVIGRLDDTTPADRWTFAGKTGQVISLTSAATSGDLDTFLTLQAPDGSTLATNDDFEGTNAALPGVLLRVDGTYTVILSRVGTRALGSAGNYELRFDTLFTLSANATPQAVIGYGQRVVGTLDVAHSTANWTFAAGQGDQIGVLLVHPTDDAPPLLSVQDPSGSILATGTLHVGQTTIDSYRVPMRGLFNLTVKRPADARAAYTPYALTLTLLGGDQNAGYPSTAPPVPNTVNEQGIAPDETVQGALDDLHPFDRWTFQAAVNQALSAEMLVTAGTLQPTLQLIGPDGKLLVDSRLDQTALGLVAAIDTVTIPVSGEYQWVATRHGSASTAGSYTLSFGVGALATETLAGQPIHYGQPVQDTITPAQGGLWVFTGQAGDAVDAIALPANASQDAPALSVTDAGGNVLAHADPVAHESAVLSFILPGSGRYVVVLTAAHATGYTLLVQRRQDMLPAKFTPRVLVKNTTLENGIQTGSLYDFWTFNAQAGAPAQIVITRVAGNLRLDVSLYGPRGYIDGKTADTQTDSLTLGPLQFPQTGTYTVVIGRWLGAAGKTSGRYLILWSDALLPFPTRTPDAPLAAIPSANFASAFDAPVGLSDKGVAVIGGSTAGYTASLDAGQIGHVWTFDAAQSPTIALTLKSQSAGLQLSALIVDAAGQVVGRAQTDSSGALALEAPLPSAGRYTLQIMPLAPGQTGTYQFQLTYALSQNGGGRLVSGEPVTGTLDNAHFTDDWRFDVPAGKQVTISAVRTAGNLALAFDLIAPDGTMLVSTDGGSDVSAVLKTVSASGDGTYTLLITRQGGAALPTTGSYQLQVTITLPTF